MTLCKLRHTQTLENFKVGGQVLDNPKTGSVGLKTDRSEKHSCTAPPATAMREYEDINRNKKRRTARFRQWNNISALSQLIVSAPLRPNHCLPTSGNPPPSPPPASHSRTINNRLRNPKKRHRNMSATLSAVAIFTVLEYISPKETLSKGNELSVGSALVSWVIRYSRMVEYLEHTTQIHYQ